MHEDWLQKYIKEHHQKIGFTELHGPYKYGADFKGIFAGKPVKIEAEWDYSDYISHQHTLKFADVLVVATLEPVPRSLREKLPSIIIHLNREQVVAWAEPRIIKKSEEDYFSYPWRRLSKHLLYLYAYYLKQDQRNIDFVGSNLAHPMYRTQTPAGFRYGAGGKEAGFEGPPEEKAAWDYWLKISHAVAENFRLKPALLRPTWIDRIGIYFSHTGKITDSELKRFKDVAIFIDDFILPKEHQEQ
jgi:hypothetical protein